jgi:hypothetical protein
MMLLIAGVRPVGRAMASMTGVLCNIDGQLGWPVAIAAGGFVGVRGRLANG